MTQSASKPDTSNQRLALKPSEAQTKRIAGREWAALIFILTIGVGLRLQYLRELVDKPDFAVPAVDAGFHDYWARGLASGNWRPPFGFPDPLIRETVYLRPPGYPYFLSLIYMLCGDGYLAPRIVQMVLGLVSAVIAWGVTRRWFGRGVALATAAFMAWYWIFIYFEGEFHAPVLTVYLLWLVIHFASAWAERMETRPAVIAGVLVGVSALVLPNMLILLPVLAAWMIWVVVSRSESGSRMHRAGGTPAPQSGPQRGGSAAATLRLAVSGIGALAAGCAAAIAPATIRNAVVGRDFVLISNNAGINLYIGNNETATGMVADRIPGVGEFKTCFDYPALVASLERQLGRPLKASEISRHFSHEALNFIRAHPADFLRLTAKKALLFWGPREVLHNKVVRYERDSSPVLSCIPLNFSLVVCLAALGVVLAWADHRAKATPPLPLSPSSLLVVLLLGVTLAYFLSVLPFFAAARYRVPIIPCLLVFAAYAVCRIATAIASGRWVPATAMSAGVAALYGLHVAAAGIVPEGRFEYAKWRYDRAVAHSLSGRVEPSIGEYQAVLELMPQNAPARLGLGLGLAKTGRTDEAITQFEAAARIWPDFTEAHFNLGVALEASGQFDRALDAYGEAVRVFPGFADAHYNRGVLLAAAGRREEAMANYAAAIRARPAFPQAHTQLASGFLHLGRLEEAERHFRAVVNMEPMNPEARCNVALSLIRQGRRAEAQREYEAALSLDPAHERARSGLSELASGPPPATTPAVP